MKASERPFETGQNQDQEQEPKPEKSRRFPFRGKSRKPNSKQGSGFKKLPGLLQLTLVSAGILTGITILGVIASLLSNEPQPIGGKGSEAATKCHVAARSFATRTFPKNFYF